MNPTSDGAAMDARRGMGGTFNALVRQSFSRKLREHWKAALAKYERPDNRKASVQVALTVALYGAAWAVLLQTVEVGYWLTMALALPAGGLMVRLIGIRHDCGHGSFLTSRKAGDWIGRIVGTLTLSPYAHLNNIHVAHHSHLGNLDIRPGGDVPLLTLDEYVARPRLARLVYRCARNPLVYMGLMVPLQFLVINRFPGRARRSRKREWYSVFWTNAVLATIVIGIWLAFGAQRLVEVLIIQCMIILYGGAMAAWLQHTQHQFEDVYWRRSGEWDVYEAGLRGASWLDLPKPLQWLTASIGLHHVHHLNPRIPNYHLQRCHDENPELLSAHRTTLWEGLKGLNLALWDEQRRKMITFAQVAAHAR